MEFDICKRAKEGVIIAAHRGVSGGNIPCNTLTAFEIALRQGADMLEIDVDRTKDGKLVIFHPTKEWAQLYPSGIRVPDMTFAEIREKVRYKNVDLTPTEYSLNTLDEVFEAFRGKCYINVDKFWENPEQIVNTIRRYDMAEQIIVKTEPSKEMFDLMETYAPEIQYLPIIRQDNVHEELMRRRLNYVGAEVLFETEDSPFTSKEFIDKMHHAGKVIWANSIVYDYRVQLAAGHSDDRAMRGDYDGSFGWLIDRGYDIIQTDWTGELKQYIDKRRA